MVEESRETIADVIGARPGDVVFTSGGTESDNLALKGIFWARRGEPTRAASRILSTAIEHHAVLDPLHWLGSTTTPRSSCSRSTPQGFLRRRVAEGLDRAGTPDRWP